MKQPKQRNVSPRKADRRMSQVSQQTLFKPPNREPRPTMLALVSCYVSEKYYYSTKIGVKISPDVSRTFCLAFVRFISTADHYHAGLNTCFLFASLRILC